MDSFPSGTKYYITPDNDLGTIDCVPPSSCASGHLIGPYAQGVKPIEIPLIHLIPEFRKILPKT